MSTRTSDRIRRRRIRLTAALAAPLVLAGCAIGPSGPPPPPFDAIPMPAEAPTVAPGQRVAVGDVVALPVVDRDGATADVVGTAVLGVAEGDAGFWSDFDDATSLAGTTPYFALVQVRWLEGDRTPNDMPLLRPFLADGSEADIIEREFVGTTAGDVCPYELPDLRLDEGHDLAESLECVVYSIPDGAELAELRWHDVPKVVLTPLDPATHPFIDDPVVWDVDPVPAAPVEG